MLLDSIQNDLGEILVGPVSSGKTDQSERGGQQAAIGQVVDRRHQFLGGQVTRDTEDHDSARTRDARHPLVALVPQRITPVRVDGRDLVGDGGHFLAASSCSWVASSSSSQDFSNFSTPSSSSTLNTSGRSTPAAASLSNTA